MLIPKLFPLDRIHNMRYNVGMLRKGTSHILQIKDPVQRLVAAVIYQAFLDYEYSPTLFIKRDAEQFLEGGGGVYKDIIDYDLAKIFKLYKEER